LILVAGGSGITPFMSILNEISSKNSNTNWHPTNTVLVYCAKRVQDVSMLIPILPILHEPTSELTNFKLEIFVTQEQGLPISALEILTKPHQVIKMMPSTRNRSTVGIAQEGLIWRAIIAALTFVIFIMSLVFLSDIFVHKVSGKSSRKNNPSWINDLLIFSAFVISMGSSAVATTTFTQRKLITDSRESQITKNVMREPRVVAAKKNDFHIEPKIYFGRRPNLSGKAFSFFSTFIFFMYFMYI
jgi:ferric-chelate reductase